MEGSMLVSDEDTEETFIMCRNTPDRLPIRMRMDNMGKVIPIINFYISNTLYQGGLEIISLLPQILSRNRQPHRVLVSPHSQSL